MEKESPLWEQREQSSIPPPGSLQQGHLNKHGKVRDLSNPPTYTPMIP